uniref:Uncharacterized protein n=1 Tax=Rhizophora mucronata TaxID=61149 RepID=A0A2P2IJ27_RHIMU
MNFHSYLLPLRFFFSAL